jgi:mono/diheme cytochrome c family protein
VIVKRSVLGGVVLVMSLCTVAIGTATAARARTAGPSHRDEPGQRVYDANCSRCHGPEGRGRGTLGPNLIPFEMSYEKALEQIRHPLCDMPAFLETDLSDAEVAQLVAYLKTLK